MEPKEILEDTVTGANLVEDLMDSEEATASNKKLAGPDSQKPSSREMEAQDPRAKHQSNLNDSKHLHQSSLTLLSHMNKEKDDVLSLYLIFSLCCSISFGFNASKNSPF